MTETPDVLSEHTLQTVDELTELLETTEDIEEIPFEFGPGYGVELEYRKDAIGDKVFLKIDKLEFPIVGDSGAHLFKKAGLSDSLLNDYPPELTIPLINWYLNEHAGSLKALVIQSKIVAFIKIKTEIYSQVDILETALKALRNEFGVTDVRVHNVSHDLNLTQYTLLFPQNSIQLDSGDVLMTGMFIQNSTLGKDALKISAVTARDYHHNAHISDLLTEQWDRRRARAVSMEDAIAGKEDPEESSDVYDWVETTAVSLYSKSENDMKTVKVLGTIQAGAHSGTILNGICDRHAIPAKIRGMINEQYVEEDGQTFLNLWNSITMVANSPEVEEKPKNVRKLMMVAGAFAAHPQHCGSCHQPTDHLHD